MSEQQQDGVFNEWNACKYRHECREATTERDAAKDAEAVAWAEVDRLKADLEKIKAGLPAYIKRKQAVAIEDAAAAFGGRDYAEVRLGLSEQAQRLRDCANSMDATHPTDSGQGGDL